MAVIKIEDVKVILTQPLAQRLIELRIKVSRAVRRLREKQQLSQQQLATKLKSSQSRVAKLESGSADVSLDLMFRGLFAVGGRLTDLAVSRSHIKSSPG